MTAVDGSAARSRSPHVALVSRDGPPRLTEPMGDRDHGLGPTVARVTLVEYGDVECPFRGRAFPIVESIRGAMGDDLRFVIRHFPIRTLHAHAGDAVEVAEGGGADGGDGEPP